MSKEARVHLTKAIRTYKDVDGASPYGKYRDVITDTLHMAYKDKSLRGKSKESNIDWMVHLRDMLLNNGYDMFEEELEIFENDKVEKIPKKDLPLYIKHKWDFESSKNLFQERFKK